MGLASKPRSSPEAAHPFQYGEAATQRLEPKVYTPCIYDVKVPLTGGCFLSAGRMDTGQKNIGGWGVVVSNPYGGCFPRNAHRMCILLCIERAYALSTIIGVGVGSVAENLTLSTPLPLFSVDNSVAYLSKQSAALLLHLLTHGLTQSNSKYRTVLAGHFRACFSRKNTHHYD